MKTNSSNKGQAASQPLAGSSARPDTPHNQLEAARAEIDRVDAEMARLFERRMAAVSKVAEFKAATGKKVFDAARETEILEKSTAQVQPEELQPFYRALLSSEMAISRAYQRRLLGRDVAAYQGTEGAWAHIALRRLFPFAKALACSTWAEVFDAVEQERASLGVLPFENSTAGDVSAVLDLLYDHPGLFVTAMADLPVRQDLLGVPSASLGSVHTVISHQQALAQSGRFLRQHGFATESWPNTAEAARHVAQMGDASVAAIASAETAKLYGLRVLAEGVNEEGDNTTRFLVVSKEQPSAGRRMALLFTVDHKPGRLARVIQIIGARGFNMESIKSRPLPHMPFEYYFYVQLVSPPAELTAQAPTREALLKELSGVCRMVRLLGLFEGGAADSAKAENLPTEAE